MAKTRDRKESDVAKYVEALKGATAIVFADISKLKVNDNGDLRRQAEKVEVTVTAAKKTLLRQALAKAKVGEVDEVAMASSIYMLVAHGDQIAPARLIADLKKKFEGVEIFGGLLESKWLNAAEIKALSSLPSREELLAKAVGSIRAPLSGLVNVLQGNLRGLVQVLNAYREAKA